MESIKFLIKWFLLFIGLILIVPLLFLIPVIIYLIPSLQPEWIGFLGNVTGGILAGIITVIALVCTIKHERKLHSNSIENSLQLQESLIATQNRPIILCEVLKFDIVDKCDMDKHFEVFQANMGFEQETFYEFELRFSNKGIGIGIAHHVIIESLTYKVGITKPKEHSWRTHNLSNKGRNVTSVLDKDSTCTFKGYIRGYPHQEIQSISLQLSCTDIISRDNKYNHHYTFIKPYNEPTYLELHTLL